MSGKNTCAICLKSLSTATAGVAVPCGHAFHVDCWAQWQTAEATEGREAKCATCNATATSFCRIFVDFDAGNDDGGGNSLSSKRKRENADDVASAALRKTQRSDEPPDAAALKKGAILELIHYGVTVVR